ncbi:hypothetical protein [Heyndrickxia ginsengihumi]|uniref:Holin n=1 Tax=Heyndrickxia ginsengihumi TaxID=363870 RepID=A0A0A6VDN5_9BACI|nr:hypothetical protein [Heyndrickxia ginsengihumi]KHD85603.1 hypothetical protein NG54_08060 [Heyndrickxia ginsengihumi]MBE6182870.1 hypothetical protein [Bacillus sp. (in: firmicutes)]MCM3023888.1 hypothetical protein [Heyndrickxia ginsengihumi]NEY19861.1 hypothetical protein [Heyndrickxia ginsengihumi]
MLEIYNVAIIPLIIGIVELFKMFGLPNKYSPILSVILGLIFGIVYVSDSIKEGIIVGLMLGLSATGLYSGSKNMIKK